MSSIEKIKRNMLNSYYLKKIEGRNWYYGRFFELCILFFFLVGLFSGITLSGN